LPETPDTHLLHQSNDSNAVATNGTHSGVAPQVVSEGAVAVSVSGTSGKASQDQSQNQGVLKPDSKLLALIPAEIAARYTVLPISQEAGGRLVLAMADTRDKDAIPLIRMITGLKVQPVAYDRAELNDAIERAYGSSVARLIAGFDEGEAANEGEAEEASVDGGSVDSAASLEELAQEPTVINLVNLILHEAIESRASDIHFEPFEKTLKVKYRIDGVLHEASPPPKHLQPAITSRVKIIAGLNIAERFVPQDGHIDFMTSRGKVDIRVSTVPTVFGESIVLRILDRASAVFDLDAVGFGQAQLVPYKKILEHPHGIVLVTGPTGSGKSTTLYASLMHIFSPERKIITIEDPVEYRLDGVNQIPVNRKRGLTFADGLRAILRQDPDVVMVGEIRDQETADIAIRAALTGHMVFSTLHTNDAPGAITRLIDMGIEPFLVASSLRAVLGQRLVRRICQDCKVESPPSARMMDRFSGALQTHMKSSVFYRGEGCTRCRQTGYRGRVGVFELMRVTDELHEAITNRQSAAELAKLLPEDHESMAVDGLAKAAEGQTTLDEVFRVAYGV